MVHTPAGVAGAAGAWFIQTVVVMGSVYDGTLITPEIQDRSRLAIQVQLSFRTEFLN